MDKHEQQLYAILNNSDKRLRKQYKAFYLKLEELIDRGYSDRVLLKQLEKLVKQFDKQLFTALNSNVNTALTASLIKNESLLKIVDFERIKLDLSPDIWKLRENIIDPVKAALKEGLPARELAKNIVGEINEFAKGKGIYKEPIKNAMRVARTEITQAYRKQDNFTWGKLDFVIGKEIRLSNSPKKHARCEICVGMAGRYPKDFEWYSWHVNCLCYQIPIQLSDEDFAKWERGELEKLPTIEVPKKAINFVNNNRARFAGWKTEPYWLKYFKDF